MTQFGIYHIIIPLNYIKTSFQRTSTSVYSCRCLFVHFCMSTFKYTICGHAHMPLPWKSNIILSYLTNALWPSNCGGAAHKPVPCWIIEFAEICWICFVCCRCGIFLGNCCDCRRFWVSNICSSTCFNGDIKDTKDWLIWGVLRSLLDITTKAAIDLLET